MRLYSKMKSGLLGLVLILGGLTPLVIRADKLLTSNIPPASLTDSNPAPSLGSMPTPGAMVKHPISTDQLQKYQTLLELGRDQRRQKSTILATKTLSGLLSDPITPVEVRRLAMFELALVSQDDGELVRAEQIFGQYLHTYTDDPSSPEVLLRQGLIYRQMGVNTLAISKFYAVMSTALKLKLDNMDYYRKIVLQSQVEIADTFYQEGNYNDAVDYFYRLLKSNNPDLDRGQTHYKLIRSLSYCTNYADTVAQAQVFLDLYTNVTEVPEVRFVLASALKKLNRNNDSMKQVLLLLQSQAENVSKNPELWNYWQQRAGNEIAGQLFKEGDYFNSLQIYLSLADLDKSPGWQMPVWYQTGLVYEQLQQWKQASDMYVRLMDRKKALTEETSTPALLQLIDMAKWRKDYIDWMEKAKSTQQAFVLNKFTNAPPANTP